MRESNAEIHKSRRGMFYRKAANFICKARIASAPLMFGYAVTHPDYPSWKFGAAMTALQASDKLDGLLSRRGAKLLGEETTADGARLDQLSDKALFHGSLGGLAVRELLNSNVALGMVYAGNQLIAGIRDWKVNRWREVGEADGIDVKARKAGKIKTAVYGLALTAACAPLVDAVNDNDVPVGEYMVAGALTAGTALAVWSGIDTIRNIRSQRQISTQDTAAIMNPVNLSERTAV